MPKFKLRRKKLKLPPRRNPNGRIRHSNCTCYECRDEETGEHPVFFSRKLRHKHQMDHHRIKVDRPSRGTLRKRFKRMNNTV